MHPYIAWKDKNKYPPGSELVVNKFVNTTCGHETAVLPVAMRQPPPLPLRDDDTLAVLWMAAGRLYTAVHTCAAKTKLLPCT